MGLDSVDLVLAVEDKFDIEIPDMAARKLITVGDLYDHVVDQLQARDADMIEDGVWESLRDLIVGNLGVRADEVVRSAQFVRDLKID